MEYKIRKYKNPRELNKPAKHYPVAVVKENRSLKYLSNHLSKRSSLSGGDVGSVFTLLSELMIEELAEGNSVTLTGIGTFYPHLITKGEEEEKNVNLMNIKGIVVRFRPDTDLPKLVKAQSKLKKQSTEPKPTQDKQALTPIKPETVGV